MNAVLRSRLSAHFPACIFGARACMNEGGDEIAGMRTGRTRKALPEGIIAGPRVERH
jgi:hypothetical protein